MVASVYQDRLTDDPGDTPLAAQYAVTLVALGKSGQTGHVLSSIQAVHGGGPLASALSDAFALPPPAAKAQASPAAKAQASPAAKAQASPAAKAQASPAAKAQASPAAKAQASPAAKARTSPAAKAQASPAAKAQASPSAHPLSAARVQADVKALQAVRGWARTYALAALYRRAGHPAHASRLEATLETQCRKYLVQFAGVVIPFCLNVVLGIVVLILWLVMGRFNDIQSVKGGMGREPSPELKFDPLGGWSMLAVFMLVNEIVGRALRPVLNSATPSVFGLLALQFVIYAMVLLAIRYVIKAKWQAIGVHFRHFGRSLVYGIGLFAGAFIIVMGSALIIESMFHVTQPQSNPVFKVIQDAGTPAQMAGMLLLVGLIGPIFEEILFRGVIYTSMRQVMPPVLAIPLNGLLFAAVHGDVHSLGPLMVLGMLLAYGYERTRSIATSAITHCLWNTQTFLVFTTLFS